MTFSIIATVVAALMSLVLIAAAAARPESRRVPIRVRDREPDPRQPRR